MNELAENWNGWCDMKVGYQNSRRKLKKYVDDHRGEEDIQTVVNMSQARSMIKDMKEIESKIQSYILYGYEAVDVHLEDQFDNY